MHKLYLTRLGSSRLYAVKAIREAIKTLGPEVFDSALKQAVTLAEKCDEVGYALIGETDSPTLVRAAYDCLTENKHAEGLIDPSEAELEALSKDATAKDELSMIEASPVYAAAMVMLTMTEGNPLKAFAYAHSLATVSNAQDHYQEIMGALLLTFPWIMEMAKIGGLDLEGEK